MSTLPNTVTIVIGSTVINFPATGASPAWSPAIIQFAEAVEGALSGIVGPADIPPQTFTIDAYNPGTSINIPNLSLSTSIVRGAYIRYSVYRTTSTTTVSETGTLVITYNPTNPSGTQWDTTRVFAGDSQIQFYVTDTGQVQFTTSALGGINHAGVITYSATANLQ